MGRGGQVRAAWLALALCAALPRAAFDGDTLWVRPLGERRPLKLRLPGIDAREICQAWQVLSAQVLGASVRVEERRSTTMAGGWAV